MVGRPRKYETEEVLDRAMTVFWGKGYEATSMSDLVDATGLHKGSLYQTFGSKHDLFLAALSRYLKDMRASKNRHLAEADTPLEGVRCVLHAMLAIADAGDGHHVPKGCMAINALVELAPHDADVRALMMHHMGQMRESMIQTLGRAQAEGQIGSDRPPELLAGLLMTFMAGLATQIKGPMTIEDAHQLLDAQLAAIT